MDNQSPAFDKLIKDDPIKAALFLHKNNPTSEQAIGELKKEYGELLKSLKETEQLISKLIPLLPVEKGRLPSLNAQKLEIEKKIKRNQIAQNARYKIFDLEPLKWRDQIGFPRLVIFDVRFPNYKIWCNCFYGCEFFHLEPDFPQAIEKCYDDVLEILRAVARKEYNKEREKQPNIESCTVGLYTQFSGIIPQKIRDEITKAYELFESIFIVADIPKWEFNKSVSVGKDPLVIGFDGEKFWLIAAFDLTPLEAYLAGSCCNESEGGSPRPDLVS